VEVFQVCASLLLSVCFKLLILDKENVKINARQNLSREESKKV